MPLHKTIIHDKSTKILVWKIEESLEELKNEIILTTKSQNRIDGMKSEIHKRAFLCVRKLLALENYSDKDLIYDETGKPYLVDKKHISISHSHQFATIIISNKNVGIDIEMEREKINLIANKFINESEKIFLSDNKIKKLTTIWGAKEAVFKMVNQKGISFKDHLTVSLFELEDKKTRIVLNFDNKIQDFSVYFNEIEDFILVFATHF